MLIRLQKYLADAGVASRRKAEQLILDGQVMVNGQVVNELGTKVDTDNDRIEYKGKKLKIENDYVYIVLYKPEKYITTLKDEKDRPTVMDLIKDVKKRVFPVGRLDYDTSGLLILTNDGDFTYRYTHPKYEIKKTYVAVVDGIVTEKEVQALENGVYIDDHKTAKAEVRIIKQKNNKTELQIIIHEGRNRQIRKMCDAVGHNVIKLERIKIENLNLNNLRVGEYRYLTEDEMKKLREKM